MKLFNLYQLSILFILTINSGCSQDIISKTQYEGCCGMEPKVITLRDNSVYIPNVFTPNGDGVNDRFYPTVRDSSLKVFALGVFSISSLTDTFVYHRQDFHFDEIEKISWDGKIRWNERNTTITGEKDYPGGPFKYSFQIFFKDNEGNWTTEFIDGTACLIRCGPEAAEFATKKGCFFNTQGIDGVYDSSAALKEDGCFK